MRRRNLRARRISQQLVSGRIATVLWISALAIVCGSAQLAISAPLTNGDCLACHGNPAFSTRLANGEQLSLYINPKTFARSVHGKLLGCTDCHTDITAIPHPGRTFRSRRAVTLAYYQICRSCHFNEYSRLLDGIHFAMLRRGDTTAPICVDCHGAHTIQPPDQPRSRISRTCGRCHQNIEAAYLKSVHGQALVGEGNPDVPVCTTCHQAHDISNPLSASWHLAIPQLCSRCHTNSKLMSKYGISTNVLTTYISDFHGMTASLYRSERVNPAAFTATCTDCHGVHDITPIAGPGSRVIKANLLKTCRRCHPGAGPSFPSAWLGHYAPSPRHAPLVYAVKLFYMILIPFMIGGLVLQIFLHLWRVVVNR